ncbi:MAG: S26 family signal peptidase, partial [Streptococcus sp.]
MSKRSSKQSSSSPVVRFLKEWGLFSIIVGLIIASRIYLWAPVKVDGHSMDPTLADSEYLLVVNHLS